MVVVTKIEFYRIMGPRDVHPRSERDRSLWIDQRTHVVLGISTPGYMCEGVESYTVDPSLAPQGGGHV